MLIVNRDAIKRFKNNLIYIIITMEHQDWNTIYVNPKKNNTIERETICKIKRSKNR